MNFDPAAPAKLKKTQKWFASIITRPIDEDNQMDPISPNGLDMETEASLFIRPSHTLMPAQRIQLYNQQYWWRLLSIMHENYPFLTRLFGYREFNQTFAFPYLVKYPSRHWSLNMLGDRLPKWIKDNYHEADKELITIAANIDKAYLSAFSAANHPPVNMDNLPIPGNPNSLLTSTLYLQPHINLFKLDADYFDLRFSMLKEEPEFWIDHDFPLLARENSPYYFIQFRTLKSELAWKLVSEAEYMLLCQFQKGSSIESCCDRLEKSRKKAFKQAGEHIHEWFQEWVIRQWLTMKKT